MTIFKLVIRTKERRRVTERNETTRSDNLKRHIQRPRAEVVVVTIAMSEPNLPVKG